MAITSNEVMLQSVLQNKDYVKDNDLDCILTKPEISIVDLDECILRTIISEGILIDL